MMDSESNRVSEKHIKQIKNVISVDNASPPLWILNKWFLQERSSDFIWTDCSHKILNRIGINYLESSIIAKDTAKTYYSYIMRLERDVGIRHKDWISIIKTGRPI